MSEEAPAQSPDNAPSGADKRRHPRVPLQILVQHRFDSVQDFVAKWSSDLSMGGVFLRTDEPREEGALVYLQFELESGEKLIEGLGKVVRCNPPGAGDGRTVGMGIEFVNFDEESLSLIEDIVSDRLKKRPQN